MSAAACITAPGIPGGPLRRPSAELNAAAGWSRAPGRATFGAERGDLGTSTAETNSSDNVLQVPVALLARLGARISPVPWFDVAADYGLRAAGVEARLGLPEGTQPMPIALAYGYQFGERESSHRLRVEAYPLLNAGTQRRLHGIVTLGGSSGAREHQIHLPETYADVGKEWGDSPTLFATRDEFRVEASAGLDFRSQNVVLRGVVMPYWITSRSSSRDLDCDLCPSKQPLGIERDWGMAVFVSCGIVFSLEGVLGPSTKEKARDD